MKRIFGVFVILFCAVAARAQVPVVPYVDERTELLGIVFRLAGAEEYSDCRLKDYANDIDTYFAPYKNHDVVKFAQEVRSNHGVGYDAVMSMAIHLEIVNQKIRIKENIRPEGIDIFGRWTKSDITRFVKLLNRFYKESEFHTFFERHHDLYQTAAANINKIFENVDFGWFENFFGARNEEGFTLIISLVSGSNSYGPKVSYTNKADDIYAIICTYGVDEQVEPTYSEYLIGAVIHEFNHSFCNPLIDEFYSQLEKQGEVFFGYVKDKMTQQAYGTSKIMLYEILVRACVIRHFESADNNPLKNVNITHDLASGFYCIEELVNSLSVYEQNRDKYPTLRSYMPEIVKLQNSLSPEDLYEKITFRGPINSVYYSAVKFVVIYPTQDPDMEALRIAQRYVAGVFNNSFIKAQGGVLMADTDALETDLSEYGIIAYGTVESNLFLKQYESSFPFRIENQTIFADKEYTDKDIKFISCVPNPHNAKKGMLICTALSNKNIQDIHNVFHGPEDYILYLNRETVLSKGFYNKNEKWSF